MKLSIGYRTDPGPRKGENQDSLLVAHPDGRDDRALVVVSDGMGGASGGERASATAIEVMQQQIIDAGFPSAGEAAKRLRDAIIAANAEIHRVGQSTPELEGMGCTIVAGIVMDDSYVIASVGDSRAYLLRGDEAIQITEDHTWVNMQLKEGLITEEQADQHALRHILERALGADESVRVDVLPFEELENGDMLLLCSDGLSGVLSDRDLMRLAVQGTPQQAADRLIERALAVPARDNVTVVLLRAEK